MPRKRTSRVYWRGGRAWLDVRDYADVLEPKSGGAAASGLEPLVADGESYATQDADVATKLAAERVEQLEQRRRSRGLGLRLRPDPGLRDYAAHHLRLKKASGKVTDTGCAIAEMHLADACDFFGDDAPLESIDVAGVQRWISQLYTKPGRYGKPLKSATVRKYLNTLSNLYRRAQSEQIVPVGYNPIAAMMDKPTGAREEAHWLEVPQASLFLEACRVYVPAKAEHTIPFLHAMVATLLLTGGRESEILGLDLDDISFDRKTIEIRPNRWRRLKTAGARRTLPMWPQLEEILRTHVFGGESPRTGLLFPAAHPRAKKPEETQRMISDIRRPLDNVAELVGWKEGEIRTKAFRHTYCAARLQTTENGAPVSMWTVMREMGHSSLEMVQKVYGHLGDIRHRSAVVEYRVSNHPDQLRDAISALPVRMNAIKEARAAKARRPKPRRSTAHNS